MKERLMLIALVLIGVLATYELATFERVDIEPPGVPRHFTPPVLEVANGLLFAWPIHEDDYIKLTSPYGIRNPQEIGGYGDAFHNGTDIAGVWKARIVAVAAGVVVEHWPAPNGYYKGHAVLGGYIRIDHGNGTESKYGHLSSTEVNEGDLVEAGMVIGRQGNTGQSQNDHLHFGLIIDGVEVNPLKYLKVP